MTTQQTQQMQKHTPNDVERMNERRAYAPPVDVYEGAEETWLVADLPGVAKDDLTIELENNELRFSAKARPFLDDEPAIEWARAFRIPPGVDSEKVTADLREGVLVLKLPKPAELKPRRIDVRGA